jgi:hypothetical protein
MAAGTIGRSGAHIGTYLGAVLLNCGNIAPLTRAGDLPEFVFTPRTGSTGTAVQLA